MEVGIKVGDIMTRNFVSVTSDVSIVECAKIMSKKHVGSVIVKKGQRLIGIVTEGDIIETLSRGLDMKNTNVGKIMTRRVVGIKPNKDIYTALMVMKKKKVRWLPVMIRKNIIGLLTEKDILKIQPALFDIASQNVKIAEEEEKWKRIKAIDEYRWVREGPCQECGAYDLLYKIGNRYLCATCRKHEEGMWEE